jgi:hypothetical protein
MLTVNNWTIPPYYEGIFKRAKISRVFAIKANCILCVGFETAQLKKEEGCGIKDCPLFPYRPYRKKEKTVNQTNRKGNPNIRNIRKRKTEL